MKKRISGRSGLEVSAIELGSDDLREIDTATAKIRMQGARLPEALLEMTGR